MSETVMTLKVDASEAIAAVEAELRKFSPAALDVLAERNRQIEAEGWTQSHDDQLHDAGDLSAAASCYALAAANLLNPYTQGDGVNPEEPPEEWPWEALWWKPGDDPRRALVKAGALILAEIERIDRATDRAASTAQLEDRLANDLDEGA